MTEAMDIRTILLSTLGTVALLLGVPDALSQQSTPLDPSGLDSDDQFGSSVAVGQTYAVVGANQKSDNGSHPGKAYVFRRTTNSWEQQAIIAAGSGFGASSAISGSTVVVGAFEEVFVFEPEGSNWVQRACLTPSTPQYLAFFGRTVSMTSERIVVGAQGEGAAYVFNRPPGGWTNGTETARITIAGGESRSFGSDVAIVADRVLVGARDDDNPKGNSAGAAYVFEPASSNWVQTAKLVGSTLQENCYSGQTVALSDEYAFVGGRGGYQPARVYVFGRSDSNWSEVAILEPTKQWYHEFSCAIDIHEPFALVGDYRDSAIGYNSGAAYLYILSTGGTWQSWGTLPTVDLSADDFFGNAVGIYSNSAFVGAFRADEAGSDSGRCYAYDLSAPRRDLRVVRFSASDGALGITLTNLTHASTVSIETSQDLTSNSWTEVWSSTITDPAALRFETNAYTTGALFLRARTHGGAE